MSWKEVKELWWDDLGCGCRIFIIVGIIIVLVIGWLFLTRTEMGNFLGLGLFALAFGSIGSLSKSRLCSALSTIIKTIICIYLFRLLSTYTDLHASTTDQRVASFGLKAVLILAIVWSYVMMFDSFSNISKKEKEEKKRLHDAEIERLNAERDYYKAQTAKQKQQGK